MSKILYWIVLKPVSRLPYFLLYRVSDFFFFLLYVVLGYRKKVVMGNLKMALPHLSEKEHKQIAWDFYRHFCDVIVEAVKNFSVKEEDLLKRMKVSNPEVLNYFANSGQSVILAGGHYANWELWALSSPLQMNMPLVAIYKKLTNAFFDDKMRESRAKYGMQLIPTSQVKNYLNEHHKETMCLVFAIDQSPGDPRKCIWIDFMGIDSPTQYGMEKYAKELNWPVVYGFITKVKRGFYECRIEVITETPREFGHGELLQHASRILEKEIYREPYLWLWTHKRWKHVGKKAESIGKQGESE